MVTRADMLIELRACVATVLRLYAGLSPHGHDRLATQTDISKLRRLSRRLDRLADTVSVATLRREYRQKVKGTYRGQRT